jgi:anionic cell wall polymer biosynthesis LytR-Cps2A-Psr (LCP) family protein
MATAGWARFWLFSSLIGWLVIVGGVLLIQVLGGRVLAAGQGVLGEFEEASGRSAWSIAGEVIAGVASDRQEPYRVLILGTDEVSGSNRPTVLTDTMMVVSYTPTDNKVRMVSLPRDLYVPKYQLKINTLYRENPVWPEQAAEELLGIPIDTTVVVRLNDVAELVDLVGGIEIDVPHTFEDDRYPRDGVDVTAERDPAKLYETVRFEAGPQMMNGSTAIKYARTRKSFDPLEGSDQSRIRRQQQVIQALTQRLTDEKVLANPSMLGKLYRWYADRFASQVPLPLLGTALKWLQQHSEIPAMVPLELKVSDLPIPPDTETLLVHPDLLKYGGQWAYDLADPSGEQLRQFVQENQL